MKKYFDLDDDIIYLNHAAVSPWPVKTAAAVSRFAKENASVGSKNYSDWLKVENSLRQKLAELINANSVNEISLLKSTSEGLSLIAYGLNWNAGDNIVLPEEEFPSNKIVWQSLQNQGVEVRLIPINDALNPEHALIAAMDDSTRLLTCSSVQYASGLKLDLEKLGTACKSADKPILFCIDAIQSIGALQFDAQKYSADFVVADGHKWMMGPEGLALFYCREDLIAQLKIYEFGWHMLENPGDFTQTSYAYSTSGTRFECGSPNMTAIHALNASLDIIFEIGMNTIESLVLKNTQYLIDQLQNIDNCEILTPVDNSRHAGIVLFSIEGTDSENLYNYLMLHGVMCASRGGGVRLSPHFYIRKEQLERVIALIAEFN